MARNYPTDQGYLREPSDSIEHDLIVVDGEVHKIYTVKVHSFFLSDVDDPDIYASDPIVRWENSEQGQWVMENAAEPPKWYRTMNYSTYQYEYAIVAKLKEPQMIIWTLKWGT